MGKGDKKTRRGKIIIKSSGVTRQKRKKSTHPVGAPTNSKTEKAVKENSPVTPDPVPAKAPAKKPATKKTATKKSPETIAPEAKPSGETEA